MRVVKHINDGIILAVTDKLTRLIKRIPTSVRLVGVIKDNFTDEVLTEVYIKCI